MDIYGSDSAGMSLAQFPAPPPEGLISPAEQLKVQLQLMMAQAGVCC